MDFAEAKRTAPTLPPETCPTVDRLSTFLDALSGDVETVRGQIARSRLKDRQSIAESLHDIESGFAYARDLLEQLRAANSQLRDSSLHWYRFAKDKEG